MAALDSQCPERPSAPRRRKQVLDAAESCFRRHGFHTTSMAQIAAEAQMSVGHIYRYFPSKGDIIAAIVERDVSLAMADFDALEASEAAIFPAFFEQWRAKIEKLSEPGRSVMWLEILAEAARNPTAAQVIREARARVCTRLCRLIEAGAPGRWSPADIRSKVELLMLLCDAVAFRVVVDPACGQDLAAGGKGDQLVQYARCIFEHS
ncbi:MAG: TetR/AcrR family transcriptional regulator [Caulobacteraceae bacterium]